MHAFNIYLNSFLEVDWSVQTCSLMMKCGPIDRIHISICGHGVDIFTGQHRIFVHSLHLFQNLWFLF